MRGHLEYLRLKIPDQRRVLPEAFLGLSHHAVHVAALDLPPLALHHLQPVHDIQLPPLSMIVLRVTHTRAQRAEKFFQWT